MRKRCPTKKDVTYGQKCLARKHSHAKEPLNLEEYSEHYRDRSDLPNNSTQEKVTQDLRGEFWSSIPARRN